MEEENRKQKLVELIALYKKSNAHRKVAILEKELEGLNTIEDQIVVTPRPPRPNYAQVDGPGDFPFPRVSEEKTTDATNPIPDIDIRNSDSSVPEALYNLHKEGKTWKEITGLTGQKAPWKTVQSYALENRLEYPIKPE